MYSLNNRYYESDPYTAKDFYGRALFETMLVIDKRVLFLDKHLTRLKKSTEDLSIGLAKDIKEGILKFVEKAGNETYSLKLQVSQSDIYMKLLPFSPRYFPDGIEAKFIEGYYQNELGMYKSANYLVNILAREGLASCFEGVFTNRLGQVTEGTISNLFFIKEGIINTPSLSLNILPGITREIFIELARNNGFVVQEGIYTKEELLDADGIFFTNSLMEKGLVWVNTFEALSWSKHEIIHKLEKLYTKMIDTMI